MEADRISTLNDAPVDAAGRYVLYWMQQSQRAHFNPALEYAISRANELDRPVVVGFGLFGDYPEANERHFAFMLEGLAEVAECAARARHPFVMRLGRPDAVCLALARRPRSWSAIGATCATRRRGARPWPGRPAAR